MRLVLDGMFRRLRRNPLRFEIPGLQHVVKIADGGFSAIYRADQPQFGRRVAVKILDPAGLNHQDLLTRFERECKTLGMLGSHPHVVSVFDAGVTKSGRPYLVMEYLRAGSLADRLDADGPLPWEEVLAIGVSLAGALQSAHQAGVLHLDITPANVLVGPGGEPKLADFGIARLKAAAGATTQALGFTPGYGAPELFQGEEPAAAWDGYGLGATLYALLVGRSPFLQSHDEKPSVEVIIGRTLFGPVPDLDPGPPEGLRAVVRRAMARRAADRYESAAELGEALQAVQREQGLAVTPLRVVPVEPVEPVPAAPRSPYQRRALVGALLVALLAAGALGVLPLPGGACARIKEAPADGVLSLGTLLPKTGTFLFLGPAVEAGVQLAMDDISAAGGITGIAVRLDPANRLDEGDPSTGTASQSTDALLSGGVDVIIGPATSAVAGKVIDAVTCAGVILFSPANTASVFSAYDDHGLYFRAAPSNVFQGFALGKLVVADGNTTVVMMARGDLYGDSFRQAATKAIEDSGGQVIDSFSYDPDAPNYNRDIQRINAKNPDAIVLIGFTESALILAKMIEQGLGPGEKHLYGTPANMTNTLARQVNPRDPGALAGMKGIQPGAGRDTFVTRLREANPGLQDVSYAAQAYDTVVITALAAAIAGTDAPAAVAEQINGVTRDGQKCIDFPSCMALIMAGRDIDYDGVSGPLEFTGPGEPSVATYMIGEFQADGSIKTLRAEEVSLPPREGAGRGWPPAHSNVIHHPEGE